MNIDDVKKKIEMKLTEEIDKMVNKNDLEVHEIKCLMYLLSEMNEMEGE